MPKNAVASVENLELALQYGNHSIVTVHVPAIWEQIGEGIRRQKCLEILKSVAHEIPNLTVSLLADVVTHKIWIEYMIFRSTNRSERTKEVEAETLTPIPSPNAYVQCLFAEALPNFLDERVTLRKEFSEKRILMSKADVSYAFHDIRVDPCKAHIACYTVGELGVIEFGSTFGWSGSAWFWGVLSVAAAHAHCNTTVDSAPWLNEVEEKMAHAKLVERWEEGIPTPIPPDAKVRAHSVRGEGV